MFDSKSAKVASDEMYEAILNSVPRQYREELRRQLDQLRQTIAPAPASTKPQTDANPARK